MYIVRDEQKSDECCVYSAVVNLCFLKKYILDHAMHISVNNNNVIMHQLTKQSSLWTYLIVHFALIKSACTI